MNKVAIVVGANGGIGQAIIKQLISDNSIDHIIGISRRPNSSRPQENETTSHNKLSWYISDYSEISIQECVSKLTEYKHQISHLFITNGILHTGSIRPERSLKELAASNLHDVFQANMVIPALWLSALTPLLSYKEKSHACVVSVLSARVGSIGDNKLGGWYSYRSSKAALNMFLKSAAIEIDRNKKNIRLIAFHPGTTDTQLSKPFQASVPEGKLFSPEFVAQKLLKITALVATDEKAKTISYLDWDNKPIEW